VRVATYSWYDSQYLNYAHEIVHAVAVTGYTKMNFQWLPRWLLQKWRGRWSVINL